VIFANRFWEKCKIDLLNVQRLANDLGVGVNTIYNLTRNRGQADEANSTHKNRAASVLQARICRALDH